jgi:hypothetical protein
MEEDIKAKLGYYENVIATKIKVSSLLKRGSRTQEAPHTPSQRLMRSSRFFFYSSSTLVLYFLSVCTA